MNRLDERIPKNMRVLMHGTGNNLIGGRTRDISRNGMYIETDAKDTLLNGGEIRVAFKTELGLQIIPSLLVRSEQDGIALMFAKMDDDISSALARVMDDQYDDTGFPRRGLP